MIVRLTLLFAGIVWLSNSNDVVAAGDIPQISIDAAKYGSNNWVQVDKDDSIGFPKNAAGQTIRVKGTYAPVDTAIVEIKITIPPDTTNIASNFKKENGTWYADISDAKVKAGSTYKINAKATVGKNSVDAKEVTITVAN